MRHGVAGEPEGRSSGADEGVARQRRDSTVQNGVVGPIEGAALSESCYTCGFVSARSADG